MFNLEISEHLSPFAIYLVTFISLFLNGVSNLPSSQIVYVTLGYLINKISFNFYMAILLGAIGNTLGNFVLYEIVKSKSDFLNSKISKLLSLNKEATLAYVDKFRHKWWGWLILGKMTPTIKVFVPIICGLSLISRGKALIIFFIGSLAWAGAVTYLGYYFGKDANLLEFYLIVTAIYIIVGALSYLKIHIKKNKK